MRALQFITDHVIFKLCYNQIYQIKTTMDQAYIIFLIFFAPGFCNLIISAFLIFFDLLNIHTYNVTTIIKNSTVLWCQGIINRKKKKNKFFFVSFRLIMEHSNI